MIFWALGHISVPDIVIIFLNKDKIVNRKETGFLTYHTNLNIQAKKQLFIKIGLNKWYNFASWMVLWHTLSYWVVSVSGIVYMAKSVTKI